MEKYIYEIYNIYDQVKYNKYPIIFKHDGYIYYEVIKHLPLEYYDKEELTDMEDIYKLSFNTFISERHKNKARCLKELVIISSNEEEIKELLKYISNNLKEYISTSVFMEGYKKELKQNYDYHQNKMEEIKQNYKKFYGDINE